MAIWRCARAITNKHRCARGIGPQFAALCTSTFVPPDALYATVEYVVNMGPTGTVPAQLRAFGKLLVHLASRRVRTVVVQIVEGVPGNNATHVFAYEHMRETHAQMVAMAQALGMPSVTLDFALPANQPYAVGDHRHANSRGHLHIAGQVLAHFVQLSAQGLNASAAHPPRHDSYYTNNNILITIY
jgi:hypothetical protein